MQQSQPQRQVFLETHVCSYFSPKMAAPRRVPTNDLVVWTLGWCDVLPLWEEDLAVERPAPAALDLGILVYLHSYRYQGVKFLYSPP
jgi:hypothetical protein